MAVGSSAAGWQSKRRIRRCKGGVAFSVPNSGVDGCGVGIKGGRGVFRTGLGGSHKRKQSTRGAAQRTDGPPRRPPEKGINQDVPRHPSPWAKHPAAGRGRPAGSTAAGAALGNSSSARQGLPPLTFFCGERRTGGAGVGRRAWEQGMGCRGAQVSRTVNRHSLAWLVATLCTRHTQGPACAHLGIRHHLLHRAEGIVQRVLLLGVVHRLANLRCKKGRGNTRACAGEGGGAGPAGGRGKQRRRQVAVRAHGKRTSRRTRQGLQRGTHANLRHGLCSPRINWVSTACKGSPRGPCTGRRP